MVDVCDLEVGVALVDELAESGHAVHEAVVRDRREAGRQCSEGLGGGLRHGKFLVVERDSAVEVVHGHRGSGRSALP